MARILTQKNRTVTKNWQTNAATAPAALTFMQATGTLSLLRQFSAGNDARSSRMQKKMETVSA
jgi:hypothetical protein